MIEEEWGTKVVNKAELSLPGKVFFALWFVRVPHLAKQALASWNLNRVLSSRKYLFEKKIKLVLNYYPNNGRGHNHFV